MSPTREVLPYDSVLRCPVGISSQFSVPGSWFLVPGSWFLILTYNDTSPTTHHRSRLRRAVASV
jgi:hypothetical protein